MHTLNPDIVYDVAVILINYNSSDYTIDCINSVFQQTDSRLRYGIVIIDNASAADDYHNLVKRLSELDQQLPLQLFRSRINTGFSGGNMLGLQFISAKYYFFLNNDCQLQNDCLNILHDFCEQQPTVALCSPQLYHENGEHQPCFAYFPYLSTKLFGLGILRFSYGKRFIQRKALYHEPVRVDVISGSQMFVRADVFHALGGFDTTFFLYCEEEDIALRVFRQGYLSYLVPAAKNIHKGGASTTASLDIKKEFYISFFYFYRKHFGFARQQLLKVILLLRLLRKSFTQSQNLQLCWFIACGAHLKHSIRHSQKIVPTTDANPHSVRAG